MTLRHLLEVDDLDASELDTVLSLAVREDVPKVLDGRGAALVFEKPSLRTRSSTELAVVQLGGFPVTVQGDEVGLDRRETAEDVVRTLASYHAVVAARVFDHGVLERMAAVSPVPVVNLLSDRSHPLQALADLLTLQGHRGRLDGTTVAWVGDGNNVCRSFSIAAALAGVAVRVATPAGYALADADVDRVRSLGGDITTTVRPEDAVEGADAVYTDVWASMGQEAEAAERGRHFEGFTVDGALLARAAPGAVLLHCLPAHRGEEVAAEVLESDASLVWQQAANRMHAARGALAFLLAADGGAAP